MGLLTERRVAEDGVHEELGHACEQHVVGAVRVAHLRLKERALQRRAA